MSFYEYDSHQFRLTKWARHVFGEDVVQNRRERGMRLLEETIEFCQSIGLTPVDMAPLFAQVFAKDPGEPSKELAQVMVCAFIACSGLDVNAHDIVSQEVHRIETLPVEHFRERWSKKVKA